MNISEVFIRRPVTTTLLMTGIVLAGAMAFQKLPISDLPNVDFPTVNVTASLPGASPETMASAVATPLERQFSSIDGLDSMTSLSTLGYTSITLQFNLRRKIADVPPDIQAAISRASALLPPGMPQPPTYQKVNPADSPIIFIALTSRQIPFHKLHEYADTLMAQRLSMINGVAQVGIFGPQKYAVHIQVNPDALASRGIGLNEIEEAIKGANVNMPVGTLNNERLTYTLQSSGQLLSAKPFEDVIVAKRNGANVRLKDVGQAIDSVEDDKTAAFFNDKSGQQRALILAVQRQPGANTVAVADEIKRLLPQLQTYLPPSVELHILYDRSLIVRTSVHDVELTLVLSFVLVVLVVFFFLRNFSATIIPTLALPISVIGTFAVMHICGYSLNNISLMALTLCIGLIVDDAIVMLENIVRHVENGETPMQAAIKGSREISFTILSMTISLAAVLVPILFMGGVVGRLFEEFGVVIIVAIVLSGIVSLTLTPMLCSRFIRPAHTAQHGFIYRAIEHFFNALLGGYRMSLDWVLRHRGFVMILNILVLAATVYLAKIVPGGFIPDDDKDQIFVTTETAQGTSAQRRIELQTQVAEIIRADPNVEAFFSGIGGARAADMGGQNMGRMFIHLKPRAERELDVYGVIQQLRAKLRPISDMAVYLQNPPNVRIGGRLTKSQYQFALQSPDLEEMYRVAPALEAKMRTIPELQDVTSDLQIKNPEITIVIDRDKAASLGISPQQVETMLSNGYAQRWISTIYAPDNQYKVLLELDPKFQSDPALLSKLYVKSTSGQLIRLDTIARFERGAGVQSIAHLGQLPAVTISFNLKPGAALGDAVEKVEAAARETLPPSITTSFQGSAQAFQAAFKGMGIVLIVAILFIYLVLGMLYESFIHPLTILSGLPSAGLGALATLWLFKMDLNVYSCVGLVMLIGIVKKNAIMQIDFALAAQRDHARSPLEAIREGCLIRFRPIMMTTMAALLGTLPIALGLGAGAESRRPLGLVVVGGLLTSQLITLYLTPVFYVYMDQFQTWLGNLRRKPHPAELPATGK